MAGERDFFQEMVAMSRTRAVLMLRRRRREEEERGGGES
jgi:hypothetical protein